MPFDHGTFTPEVQNKLLEAQREDNKLDGFHYDNSTLCTVDTDIDSEVGAKPIEDLAYQYGRGDRSSEITDGDRARMYNEKLGTSNWAIHSFMPAKPLKKLSKVTYDSILSGGALDRLSLQCGRQASTDLEKMLSVITKGTGSAGDETLPTVVVLPGGDEFNAATPAKTPERYFREAYAATGGGGMMFVCEDVLFALFENENMAENGLNNHSMTETELRSWLSARGITQLIISKQKMQVSAPEFGHATEYIHAGACMIGQPGAIIRYVMTELGYNSARDELADTDYVIARADQDLRIPFAESIVVFTNTLA